MMWWVVNMLEMILCSSAIMISWLAQATLVFTPSHHVFRICTPDLFPWNGIFVVAECMQMFKGGWVHTINHIACPTASWFGSWWLHNQIDDDLCVINGIATPPVLEWHTIQFLIGPWMIATTSQWTNTNISHLAFVTLMQRCQQAHQHSQAGRPNNVSQIVGNRYRL